MGFSPWGAAACSAAEREHTAPDIARRSAPPGDHNVPWQRAALASSRRRGEQRPLLGRGRGPPRSFGSAQPPFRAKAFGGARTHTHATATVDAFRGSGATWCAGRIAVAHSVPAEFRKSVQPPTPAFELAGLLGHGLRHGDVEQRSIVIVGSSAAFSRAAAIIGSQRRTLYAHVDVDLADGLHRARRLGPRLAAHSHVGGSRRCRQFRC
mmetsp:Transcript_39746/g.114973  ORF Transcript_39746/g.114973 Transcript_39746/m.114973 type:complete len:209 (+) Transcript_39746:811-1437(+)